jgi:hypothetical protein
LRQAGNKRLKRELEIDEDVLIEMFGKPVEVIESAECRIRRSARQKQSGGPKAAALRDYVTRCIT